MVLEEKIDIETIVRKAGMSSRPEYYSGRGATTSDLNDEKLERIYEAIKKEHGQKAADNYVKMVAEMEKLSATDFLLNLYGLDSNKWKYEKRLLGNKNGIYAGKLESALGTVACVLTGDNERDQTDYIRNEFLRRHGIEPKFKEQGIIGGE